MRERVYKKRVGEGKMPAEQSIKEIAAMRAVLVTLEAVQAAAIEHKQPSLGLT